MNQVIDPQKYIQLVHIKSFGGMTKFKVSLTDHGNIVIEDGGHVRSFKLGTDCELEYGDKQGVVDFKKENWDGVLKDYGTAPVEKKVSKKHIKLSRWTREKLIPGLQKDFLLWYNLEIIDDIIHEVVDRNTVLDEAIEAIRNIQNKMNDRFKSLSKEDQDDENFWYNMKYWAYGECIRDLEKLKSNTLDTTEKT